MKKTVLLALLAFGMNVNAQIEVRETTNSKINVWSNIQGQSLKGFVIEEDTIYGFYYKDANYQHITVVDYISFNSIEEVKQFLDLCKSAINEKKEYMTEIYSVKKLMKSAVVYHKNAFFYLSLKNIEKMNTKINELNL